MELKTTKGDWFVSNQNEVIQIVTGNLILAECYANASRKIDAETCFYNAKLMANAPKLLKALQDLRGIEAHIQDAEMRKLFQRTVYPVIEDTINK